MVAALWRRRITIAFNKKPPGKTGRFFLGGRDRAIGMIFSEERRLPRITRDSRIMP